mgnify:CR=1 FL=1
MGIKLYFKNYRTKGFLVGFGLAVLWIMAGFLVMVVPQAAIAAEPAALTVTGDGVDKTVSFTMAELNALPQKTYTYSGYNHWPSLQLFQNMTGPTLQSILDVAGLKDEATLIRAKSTSGAYSDFIKEQLLQEPRYYFPDGEKPGDVTDWPPQRSEKGKKLVETIIALNETNGKLIYGQRAPNEPTCCMNQMLGGVCNGGTIEVLTTPPEQWAAPHADPAPGKVAPGTKVTLQHEDGMPYHAIVYYTLDGSEPTYGSSILNISYPNFQPEMNKPVPINDNATIKTRTIGMGKLDSEVVTYQYYTGSPAPANEAAEEIPDEEPDGEPDEDKVAAPVIPDYPKHFTDVEQHWAKDDLNYLLQKGIIAGMTDTEFKPEEKITRAQFAKLLITALNLEVNKGAVLAFQDVPAGAWYHDSVATAVNGGLIKGYSDSVFAPDENITREQLAVIISRVLQMKSSEPAADGNSEQIINKFTDQGDIAPWARQGIALAVSHGIVSGVSEDTFAPRVTASRAEAAVMILRLYRQLDFS